jgi:hypothetical protein
MKITTLLPLADNDGVPFPADKIDNILQSLTVQFHGCSTDGKVDGRSLENGITYKDQSLRVTIVCDNVRLFEVQNRIREIGRELGQVSMYFEVRDYDGVQLLRITSPAE